MGEVSRAGALGCAMAARRPGRQGVLKWPMKQQDSGSVASVVNNRNLAPRRPSRSRKRENQYHSPFGGLAERFKAPVLKTGNGATRS